jgi:HSP20 family protein
MRTFTRWQLPLQDYRSLHHELNRAFEPFLRTMQPDEDLVTGAWTPPVDVYEEPDRIVIIAEVPGLRQEEIEINYADGLLTIRGERKPAGAADERKYHRVERTYGNFVRSFTLPGQVDPERIRASYTEGLLQIEAGKREEAKPKQIRITVS